MTEEQRTRVEYEQRKAEQSNYVRTLGNDEPAMVVSKIWVRSMIPPVGEKDTTLTMIEDTVVNGRTAQKGIIRLETVAGGIVIRSDKHKTKKMMVPLPNIRAIEFVEVIN